MDMKGRVAMVTGASRGIGRAVAVRLAQSGAVIAGIARNEPALQETSALVQAAGSRMRIYLGDIGSTESMATIVDQICKDEGNIDILVNNAGITRDNLLLRMKSEEWDEVIQVNLKGVFNTCRAALRPMLRKKAGRIINVTSIVGIVGGPGQTNYAASKAGIIGFTKSLAKEVASRNITINAVAPGFIVTDMTSGLTEDLKKEALSRIPLQRFGAAEDVADAVAFLASDAAAYVTGHVLQVDGGLAM